MINASSACARATPLPSTWLSNPSCAASRNSRALKLQRTARRLDRPWLMAVAIDPLALAGARVALAAQELGHLIFEHLLHDQPRTQTRDPSTRIVVHRHRLAPHQAHGVAARSGLSSRCGRTSNVSSCQDRSGGYVRATLPRSVGRHRPAGRVRLCRRSSGCLCGQEGLRR
jgi:hypothetical protein